MLLYLVYLYLVYLYLVYLYLVYLYLVYLYLVYLYLVYLYLVYLYLVYLYLVYQDAIIIFSWTKSYFLCLTSIFLSLAQKLIRYRVIGTYTVRRHFDYTVFMCPRPEAAFHYHE